MGPQDAHAGRVERGDPHRPGDRADEFGDAAAHLVGRLVGERDGEDRRRRHALVDEVGDAMGEHPRLARSGAGDDQQRSAAVDDGVELVGVEPGERVAAVRRDARRRCCRGSRSRGTHPTNGPSHTVVDASRLRGRSSPTCSVDAPWARSMAGVIRLPDPCLVVIVGPAGCGKSTWAARSFRPEQVDLLGPPAGDGRHRRDGTSAPARRRSRCSISSSTTASGGG